MDREELTYIYDQGHIELKEEKIDEILKNVNTVLDSYKNLEELENLDIEMLEVVSDKDCELREDNPKESLKRSLALKNTDLTEYGYFKINDKVVDDE